MDKIFDLVFKEDLLRGVDGLLRSSTATDGSSRPSTPVSLGLIVALAAIIAVIRTLYLQAQFSLSQHFIAAFVILTSIYILFGIALLLLHVDLKTVNQKAAYLYLCLLASCILLVSFVVLFGFIANPIFDWIDGALGLDAGLNPVWVDYIVGKFETFAPIVLISFIGCWVVFRYNADPAKRKIALKRKYAGYAASVSVTSVALYYAAFERSGFFESVMLYIGRIKI